MTGQNISTATGYSTTHEAGVPLQTDPANIVRAFTEYHYGANYTGGAKTSGIDYHLSLKAPLADPNLTGTVDILNSSTQLILKNASDVAKAAISTNTGIVSNAVTDDLSINTQGTKILLGVAGAEILRVDSAGLKILSPSTLQVTGSAAFSGSVQFTGHPTAPTQSASNNSTRIATTAYADNQAYSQAVSYATAATINISHYTNLLNAIELYQPIGNGTTVTQLGTAVTAVGTAAAVNVTSTTTNYVLKSRRIQYGTAATAGTTASIRNALAQYSLDNGFQFYARFAPQSIRPASASRGFFGMWATTTALPNAAITTLTNMFGIGWDAGDSTYYWYNNDATGTAVRTQVGAGVTIRTDDMVELLIHAYSNTIVDMAVKINNKQNGSWTETRTLQVGTDDMPTSSQLLSWHLAISNGAAAANYAMDINKVVVRAQDIRTNNDNTSIYYNAIQDMFFLDS